MKIRKLVFLMASLMASGELVAQATDAEPVVLPYYDVELVIFKNIQVPRGKEYILPVSSPSRGDKVFDLSSGSSVQAGLEQGYEFVPPDQLRLLKIVTGIIQSPRYDLLLHTAWRQPGVEREQVLPVWIKGGRIYGNEYTSIDSKIELQGYGNLRQIGDAVEFNEESLEASELKSLEPVQDQNHTGLYELEGKITVALSRYLHTYADLVLRRPRLLMDPVLEENLDPSRVDYSPDTRILNNHHLKEHRRMRSKTLHYLDNPEFGMVILITAYKVPENFVEVLDEEELNGSGSASE